MAITLADFNKIWASTSPLTPYSFSESNYKQGWNFIGSTPPARQMWDFLQKNNDEKMQYLANNYLPLAGGTITGNVAINGGKTIHFIDGSDPAVAGSGGWIGGVGSGLRIAAENYSYLQAGGRIELRGRNYATDAGKFDIVAADTNNEKILTGKPDGTLKWGNNDIALAKDVLPLSGGTMTGVIKKDGNALSPSTGDATYLTINGALNTNNGGSLTLFGKDHAGAGRFSLTANNGTVIKELRGQPNGTLTWGGNQLGLQGCTNTRVTLTSASSTYTFTFGGEIVTIMAKRDSNYAMYLVDYWGAGAAKVVSGGNNLISVEHESVTRTVTITRDPTALAVPVQIIHSDIAW